MNSGYYAALTGLVARTQAFELAANNLANANTNGYKAQNEFYQSLVSSAGARPLSPLNRAVNDFGVLGGGVVDLSPGSLERTGSQFDLAIEGSGFFAVQTAAGERYTRDGNFHVNAAGQLVTKAGDLVLGEQGPVQVPAGALSVSPDGTLSVDGALAGRLLLVEPANGAALAAEGNSYYAAPAGTVAKATASTVRQGALEASNVNPVAGSVGLIALQRHMEMLQRALTIFHNDMNRIAAEDLGRV